LRSCGLPRFEKPIYRVVEQREQVLRLRRSAHGIWQRYSGDLGALAQPFHRLWILIGATRDGIGRLALQLGEQVRQLSCAWRYPRLGLDVYDLFHSQPMDEIGSVFVIGYQAHTL